MNVRAGMVAAALALCAQSACAAFVEDFSAPTLARDPAAHKGWATFTGSGEATMTLTARDGHGVMDIDATHDRRNIWWATIKHAVSPYIDKNALGDPAKALRVEAKIRLSDAPRRVNLSLNHTHTTNYDTNLAEFDIPDTDWHVISYTDKTFDARPQDEVFAQLAIMDAGRQRLRIEIAYFKVSVVDAATAPPDLGRPLTYRPALPPLARYRNAVPAAQDAMVDAAYPWVNYRNWSNRTDCKRDTGCEVLSVSGSQIILLRFDLSHFKTKMPKGWGALELTTDHVDWAPTDQEEFGYLRMVEIKGGDPDWNRDTVTRDSFFAGRPAREVLNPQLIVDVPPAFARGGRTVLAVSPPVLQRLFSGKTKGLAILAQGAVNASFASSRSPDPKAQPTLYFDVQ